MQGLAQNYTQMDQFLESIALHKQILELRASTDPDWRWSLVTYAIACQGASKLDEAEILLQKALALYRKREASGGPGTAYVLGWLARNLLLQERYTEAEKIAREGIALYEKELPYDPEGFYVVSTLGGVLFAQGNYTQAEPLLLRGYEGMKRGDDLLIAVWKRRMAETGERIVRFYEETNQPGKAREWREKLIPSAAAK
jgi:tetratricopeptide (TPR) repeat protein